MENEYFCFPCTCVGEMHVITGFCSVRGPPRGLMQEGQTRWGPCLPVAGEVGCGSLKKCITTSLFLSSVIWVASLRERCSVFTCSLQTLIGKEIKILVMLIRIMSKNIRLTPHKWCSYPNINSDYTCLSATGGYYFPFFLSAFFTYQIDSHEKLN